MNNLTTLYHQDYSAWAQQMADLLKTGNFLQLDVEHLVEELENMGKSERRELDSRLRVLLAHLLKWQYQYHQLSDRWQEFNGKSWKNTIVTQRAEIRIHLKKYPNIKQFVPAIITEAYQDARELAAYETNLSMDTFPSICPYSELQIFDSEFYPNLHR